VTAFRRWARAAFDAFTLALVALVALVTAPLWISWLAYRRIRDGAWPLFLAATLALVTTFSGAGCGASALDRATTALGAAHALQSGAVAATRVEVRDDLREACAGETTPEAIDECIAERTERWRATEAGIDLSKRALDEAGVELLAWAERVHADEADPDAAPRTVCERMKTGFEAVAHVLRLLDALGVRMPDGVLDGMPTWECEPPPEEDPDPSPDPDPAAPEPTSTEASPESGGER
jgi:hypothetical protein